MYTDLDFCEECAENKGPSNPSDVVNRNKKEHCPSLSGTKYELLFILFYQPGQANNLCSLIRFTAAIHQRLDNQINVDLEAFVVFGQTFLRGFLTPIAFSVLTTSLAVTRSVVLCAFVVCCYWSVGDAPAGTIATVKWLSDSSVTVTFKKNHFTNSQRFWIWTLEAEVTGLLLFWALLSDISASVIQILFFISWRILKKSRH